MRPTPLFLVLALVALLGCGQGNSIIGGNNGDGGSRLPDGGTAGPCVPRPEVCDGIDNDCDRLVDEDFDVDHDLYTSCAGDCNDDPDGGAAIHPGVVEVSNSLDDDCNGKVDDHIEGRDYDRDGTPYPQDCDDDEAMVGPKAVEVAGDAVDNNCDGQVDEPAVSCEPTDAGLANGGTAVDFARAIDLCPLAGGFKLSLDAGFPLGTPPSRNIRSRFGTHWTPRAGTKMVLLSSGSALDDLDDASYQPQPGVDHGTTADHPLYSAPRCATPGATPRANDPSSLAVTLTVPQNANSFSFQFNFFSAEYPEFVCTQYNDRFIAVLTSSAIDTTKLPAGQCVSNASVPTCNISYDAQGQPVTVNNGFFDVCIDAADPLGTTWSNTCTQSPSLLDKTGYETAAPHVLFGAGTIVGGATGWLTTKAPVSPGETITLRFIVFDEGDSILDSAVLIDNFKWDAAPVQAPVTIN